MNLYDLLEQISQILIPLKTFWEKMQRYYFELPFEDFAMQLIVIAIFIILVFTIILAITVLLLRIKNTYKAYRYKKTETAWEKVLINSVLFDEDGDGSEIIVRRRNRLLFVQYLYQFAQRLQGEELKRIKAIAEPYLDVILKGTKGDYPELRARNLNILGTFGFPKYIDVIKYALNDRSPIVTMTAARALAKPDYPQHCRVILPVLGMFDQWSMNFLSSMLAEMGSQAAPDLRKAMAKSGNTIRVRIACAEALRRLDDIGSADLAVELLQENDDAEFQAALLRLLREVGVPRHRPVVIKFLNSSHFIVRATALSVLAQIGGSDDGELIRGLIEDDSAWVALHSARALRKLNRSDLLEPLANSDHRRAAISRQVLSEDLNG